MSKSIKVSEKVYNRLTEFQDKRETFSDAVSRLLDIRDGLAIMTRHLEGQKHYAEQQAEQLRKTVPTNPGTDSTKVPDVSPG